MHNIELHFVRKLTSLRITIDKKFVLKQTQGFNCTCISEISFEIPVEIPTSINLPTRMTNVYKLLLERTKRESGGEKMAIDEESVFFTIEERHEEK